MGDQVGGHQVEVARPAVGARHQHQDVGGRRAPERPHLHRVVLGRGAGHRRCGDGQDRLRHRGRSPQGRRRAGHRRGRRGRGGRRRRHTRSTAPPPRLRRTRPQSTSSSVARRSPGSLPGARRLPGVARPGDRPTVASTGTGRRHRDGGDPRRPTRPPGPRAGHGSRSVPGSPHSASPSATSPATTRSVPDGSSGHPAAADRESAGTGPARRAATRFPRPCRSDPANGLPGRRHPRRAPCRVRFGPAGPGPRAPSADGAPGTVGHPGRADGGPQVEQGLSEGPPPSRRHHGVDQVLGLAFGPSAVHRRPGPGPGRHWCRRPRRRARRRRPGRPGPCRAPPRAGPAGTRGRRAPPRRARPPRCPPSGGGRGPGGCSPCPPRPISTAPSGASAQAVGVGNDVQESVVGGDDPGQLGLLGHGLAHQHGPRVTGGPPRQVVPPGGTAVGRTPRLDGRPEGA